MLAAAAVRGYPVIHILAIGGTAAALLGPESIPMDGIIWRRAALRTMRADQFNVLVKIGRLVRAFRGLYLDEVTVAGMDRGAVLRRAGLQFADGERPPDSDDSSYLCCWSAAEEWDLPLEALLGISVSVPRERTVTKQYGLAIHRHACQPSQIRQRRGVRVVPLELALVQAFSALPKDARRQLVIRSIQDRKVYADRVRPYISRTTPRRAELLDLLALAEAGAHSELEIKALLAVFRRYGIHGVFCQQFADAIPERSVPMDFAAPDLHLNIEADGSKYHSAPDRRSADVRRDLDLSRHRWKVLRCLYENVVD
jgi:hypothetical protein